MKESILLLLIVISSVNIKSQIISGYGLKLGAAFSNQTWDYNTDVNMDWQNKFGISPRIFVDLFNYTFIELEGEVGYLQKGFKYKMPVTTMYQPDGTGEYITVNNRLDYLSFAALAKLKYNIGIFSPYLLIGPQLNIMLSKNIDTGWEIVFDKFKKNNVGLSLGAGIEIKNIFPISILIEYRYERDFIDNYDSPNINFKNYSHVILLGVKI